MDPYMAADAKGDEQTRSVAAFAMMSDQSRVPATTTSANRAPEPVREVRQKNAGLRQCRSAYSPGRLRRGADDKIH